MKKKVALPIVITAGAVAAILIAILTLSLIYVNPFKSMLGGYDSVEVYNMSATYPYPNTELSSKEVDKGIDDTKFSVMHAILEGRFAYAPKFKTVKNEDGDKERVSLNTTEIHAVAADTTRYMMLFSYNTPKTIRVQGEDVTFDRAKIKIYDTAGEVEKIEVYAYMYDSVTLTPLDPYYSIDVIEIYTTTSKLVNVLSDYANLLK